VNEGRNKKNQIKQVNGLGAGWPAFEPDGLRVKQAGFKRVNGLKNITQPDFL